MGQSSVEPVAEKEPPPMIEPPTPVVEPVVEIPVEKPNRLKNY